MVKEVDIGKLDRETKERQEEMERRIRTGAYIKKLRTDKGLSLAQLGKELGCSAPYVSGIESGVRVMSDQFIRGLADYFGMKETVLFDLLARVPLLTKEQIEESDTLKNLFAEIKANKKLSDEDKHTLFNQMVQLYKDFPES